ncbi:MAG: hypothetical protein H6R19_2752 [Proteobacteria bacterium]|nr:hypothetical protein [Pseudomonadota bacterium]
MRFGHTLALGCALLAQVVSAAPTLRCHYTYGGETHTVSQAQHSVAAGYAITPTPIGSYLLFRPLFEADTVKLYTYVDHPDGPVLLHQARYPYPAATRSRSRYGFTGEQRVYEPVRDSELVYWCEIAQ